jgi:hypothetical protein
VTRDRIGRIAGVAPLACSALAFAIVIANVVLNVPAQPDEGASAHMWQLLIAVQLPLIALFAATADWRRSKARILLGAQLLALTAACVPVFLAGY